MLTFTLFLLAPSLTAISFHVIYGGILVCAFNKVTYELSATQHPFIAIHHFYSTFNVEKIPQSLRIHPQTAP